MISIDVSIIIVTWNNENEIVDCINSIYEQTKEYSFEIIVVDNKSFDNTVKILKNDYPRVKVISSDVNLGFSKANNLGVNIARGKNILFLNPDIILLEEAVDKTIDCLQSNESFGIVSCKLLNKDLSLQPSTFRFLRTDIILIEQFNLQRYFKKSIGKYYGFFGNHNRCVDWCIGAFLLMRKEDVLKIRGFSEEYFMYMEDLDICYKVHKQLSKKIFYLNDASCIHLGGASEKQDLNNQRSYKIFDSLLIFLNLHIAEKKSCYLNVYIYCYQVKKILFSFYNLFKQNDNIKKCIEKYEANVLYLKNKKECKMEK